MSDAESDPGLLKRAYRTVTPEFVSHPDAEMNLVGWSLFLALVVLLVPLLPLLVVGWLVSKFVEFLVAARGRGE